MKTLITSLLLGSLVVLSSFVKRGNIDEVIGALRSGNATTLSNYFDETVDLTLPDQSDNYSKAQALLILKDFFNNNGVKTFDVKHKGDNGGEPFCIGTLQTRSGNFRTTVYMKIRSGKPVVKTIRFNSIE